jgi:hypothetical protein
MEKKKRRFADVKDAEDWLSHVDSRVSGVEAFKAYLKRRFEVEDYLKEFYGDRVYRLHRWWNWRDRRKSEDRFIQRAVKTFGKNAVLAYGDWSAGYAMKHLAPTPTRGLRARLAKKLKVVMVEEYNTTKLCSRCHGETVPDPVLKREVICKDGSKRKDSVRGIRRCYSAKCGGRYWNRDLNAAINIASNLRYAIQHQGQRHPQFRRPPPPPPTIEATFDKVATCPT